jgi:tRNA-splicing endonuclease subunit Sen54
MGLGFRVMVSRADLVLKHARGEVDQESCGTGALYEKLRIIPAGHSHPVTISPSTASTTSANEQEVTEETDLFAPLVENPYLPFYHVWKPNTHWTMAKWDKASPEGLEAIPPAFWIG